MIIKLRGANSSIIMAPRAREAVIETDTAKLKYSPDGTVVKTVATEDYANNLPLDGYTTSGWQDLVSELHTRSGTSAPTIAQFRDGIYLYSFPSNQQKEVFCNFHVRHDYKLGSNLYPHFHWATNTTTAIGTVRWGFEYTVAKGHGQQAFSVTTTVYVTYTFTNNQQYIHQVSEVNDANAISSTNIEPDTMILMRIFRDVANDDYPDAVFGMTADIHYQVDRLYTKNKSPNFYT